MADSIDLNNRNLNVTTHLDAQKTLWLLARYRGNKIFFDFLYFVDRQIGKCGLILKRYYPSLYRFLRKNHRTNAVAIAGDYRINMIVEKYASKTPNFFFIQIGSNDGVTKDPLFGYIAKFGWKGILVEPVKYLFDKLKETYDFRDGLYFENVAIDVEDGVKALYRIKKSDTEGDPAYYEQIGSLKRSVVEKHRGEIPNFEERIMTENVRCISLQSLLSKYQVINIDLMHIDTEGNDYEIIRSIPFDVLRPKMILYEHVHLSADDQYACQNLLQSNGYRLLKTTYDTFAYLTID
jgi:FkbM family methyltransferase